MIQKRVKLYTQPTAPPILSSLIEAQIHVYLEHRDIEKVIGIRIRIRINTSRTNPQYEDHHRYDDHIKHEDHHRYDDHIKERPPKTKLFPAKLRAG